MYIDKSLKRDSYLHTRLVRKKVTTSDNKSLYSCHSRWRMSICQLRNPLKHHAFPCLLHDYYHSPKERTEFSLHCVNRSTKIPTNSVLFTMCLYYEFVCPQCGNVDTRLERIWGQDCAFHTYDRTRQGRFENCPKKGYGGTTPAPRLCPTCEGQKQRQEQRKRAMEKSRVWGV
jgi:hypothetical protein